MTPSRSLALLATAVAALVLTACTAGGPPYADLAGEPTAQDALPADLPDHAYRDVDVDSSRYVGDDGGTQLWLVRGTERDSVCLVTVTDIDADDWQIGCSGAAGPLTTGSYVVHSDGYPTPDDAVPISENVYRN